MTKTNTCTDTTGQQEPQVVQDWRARQDLQYQIDELEVLIESKKEELRKLRYRQHRANDVGAYINGFILSADPDRLGKMPNETVRIISESGQWGREVGLYESLRESAPGWCVRYQDRSEGGSYQVLGLGLNWTVEQARDAALLYLFEARIK